MNFYALVVLLMCAGLAVCRPISNAKISAQRVKTYQKFLFGTSSSSKTSYYGSDRFPGSFFQLYAKWESLQIWLGPISPYTGSALSRLLGSSDNINLNDTDNLERLAKVHRYFWVEQPELVHADTQKSAQALQYCYQRRGVSEAMFAAIEEHYICCSIHSEKQICPSTGRKCPEWGSPLPLCLSDLHKVWNNTMDKSRLIYEWGPTKPSNNNTTTDMPGNKNTTSDKPANNNTTTDKPANITTALPESTTKAEEKEKSEAPSSVWQNIKPSKKILSLVPLAEIPMIPLLVIGIIVACGLEKQARRLVIRIGVNARLLIGNFIGELFAHASWLFFTIVAWIQNRRNRSNDEFGSQIELNEL